LSDRPRYMNFPNFMGGKNGTEETELDPLDRRFSLGRVLAKGSPATAVWTGFAIFAFNLWQQT